MEIYVNNIKISYPDDETVTLEDIIEQTDKNMLRLAVSVNDIFITRKNWEHTLLKDGDRVKRVSLIAGG